LPTACCSPRKATRDRSASPSELFSKKSQKTPLQTIALAERRLRDWRSRGRDTGR
jgi:hypothetical protein